MFWYFDALKQFTNFTGVSSINAFWSFFLYHMIITAVLIFCEVHWNAHSLLDVAYSIVLLIPTLAITVRRLHDSNRSGWWISIILLPVFGFLILFVLLLQPSADHDDFESNSFSIN